MTGRDWDDIEREVDTLLRLAVHARQAYRLRDAPEMREIVKQAVEWASQTEGYLYPWGRETRQ